MAIKSRYRVKNTDGIYETIHLETTADQVLITDDKQFVSSEEKNEWNNKANATHTHQASQVAFINGKTLQQTLDNGDLKGEKGEKGDSGVYVGTLDDAPDTANIIIDDTDEGLFFEGFVPDIQIGDITTLESDEKATVTKRGTLETPIFDIGIPRGKSGKKLIARYVHNANKVVQPTSLDLETGIFTCNEQHGLTEGTQLYLRYTLNTAPANIPIELYEMNTTQWGRGRKKAHIIDEYSFQVYALSSTSDNPLTFSTERNTNVDVSKFSFECDLKVINITNIDTDNIEFLCNGFITGGYFSTEINGKSSRMINNWSGQSTAHTSAYGQVCCYMSYMGKASIIEGNLITHVDVTTQTISKSYSYKSVAREWASQPKIAYSTPTTSTNIGTFKPVSSEAMPLNGFTVEIWGSER